MHENAGDALEVGHAAQADAQPHAGLWKEDGRWWGLAPELSQVHARPLGVQRGSRVSHCALISMAFVPPLSMEHPLCVDPALGSATVTQADKG